MNSEYRGNVPGFKQYTLLMVSPGSINTEGELDIDENEARDGGLVDANDILSRVIRVSIAAVDRTGADANTITADIGKIETRKTC